MKYVKRLEEVGRTYNFAKPLTVDFYDTTGTVKTGQRPVSDPKRTLHGYVAYYRS